MGSVREVLDEQVSIRASELLARVRRRAPDAEQWLIAEELGRVALAAALAPVADLVAVDAVEIEGKVEALVRWPEGGRPSFAVECGIGGLELIRELDAACLATGRGSSTLKRAPQSGDDFEPSSRGFSFQLVRVVDRTFEEIEPFRWTSETFDVQLRSWCDGQPLPEMSVLVRGRQPLAPAELMLKAGVPNMPLTVVVPTGYRPRAVTLRAHMCRGDRSQRGQLASVALPRPAPVAEFLGAERRPNEPGVGGRGTAATYSPLGGTSAGHWLERGFADPAADREKKLVDDWMKRHSRGQYGPKPESRGV